MNIYRFLFLCAAFLLSLLASTAQKIVPVFTSGNEGHKSYRIPAIIQLSDGELLAFAEGRVNGADDFGDVDIVMKRSKDRGKTWSPATTLVDYEKLQAGNPAPVVDLLDPLYPKGRLFLFYNTGNNHEDQVRKGNGIREVWYKTSTDGGFSWSEPTNITLQVHKPKQPSVNQAYSFSDDWRHYANTPGHALQLIQKPYAGRIYVAANHSEGKPKNANEDYFAHGFYSDDHGKTFHLSENVSVPGSNESTAAELSGGKLMLNVRNQKGDIKARIVALSRNGGENWDTIYFDNNLPDPVCEGSILNAGKRKGKQILAFCNAANTKNRNNLTLRLSFDEGKTWALSLPVDKGSGDQESDFTAYSDIVKLNKKTIGVLYERDNYSQIAFKIIKWK
ncbi:MAG TPA: sialidase family protein [Prolixibacteraceae bacterium]|nr:sialidase family protein [Prolixibacteraceae bacterium]HPR85794.1 sialidase family protein [Prolixibacteraceae bacterium]